MAAPASSFSLTSAKRRQAVIGLMLAAGIVAAWLALLAFAMFAFELTWVSLPLAIAIIAAECWLFVGLFIISHDAMHGSLAPGHNRLNSAIGASLLFLYAGFGWRKLRAAHFAHHRLAGRPGDPDFDEHHPASFWPWYGTFLRRYFGPGSLVYVCAVVWFAILVLEVPRANVIVLYAVPSILSSIQLFYFGTYRPHCHNGTRFTDRHNARSERFGTLASLASCYHFGYHHEHHCHPETPWWQLPKVRLERIRNERMMSGGKTLNLPAKDAVRTESARP